MCVGWVSKHNAWDCVFAFLSSFVFFSFCSLSTLHLHSDAAHAIHPMAGQGLNLGLGDVECLAKLLCDAVEGGNDIGDAWVLDRFERHRKPRNLRMALSLHALKATFACETPSTFPLVRGLSLAVLNNVDVVKV